MLPANKAKCVVVCLLSCVVLQACAGRFSKYKTCDSCVSAGFGWSTTKNKCGGYPNKVCPGAPTQPKVAAAAPASGRVSPPPPPGGDWNGAGGKFDYDTCKGCVAAGSGWCPIQRRCGGFATGGCPSDERAYMRTPAETKEFEKSRGGDRKKVSPEEAAAIAAKQADKYRKLMNGEAVKEEKADDGLCTEEHKNDCAADEDAAKPAKEVKDDTPDPGSDVIILTDDNYKEKLQSGTWLLEFYAPWCAHCKDLAPTYEEIAHQMKIKSINVAKVDVIENQIVRTMFAVSAFPAIKALHGGKLCTYDGDRSKEELINFVEAGCEGELGAEDIDVKLYGKKRAQRPAPEMPEDCKQYGGGAAPAWFTNKAAHDKEMSKALGIAKGYPKREAHKVKALSDGEEVAIALSLCAFSDVENVVPFLKSTIFHATVKVHIYLMAPEDVMPDIRCQTDGFNALDGVVVEYIYQEDEMHRWREDLYNFAQGNPYKNDKGECNVAKLYFPSILDDVQKVIVVDSHDPIVMTGDVGALYMWFDAMDGEYIAAAIEQSKKYIMTGILPRYAIPEPVDDVGFSSTVVLYNLEKCREGGVNDGALKAMVGSWKNLGSMDDRDIINIFAKNPNFVSKMPCSWNVKETKSKKEYRKECLPSNIVSLDPKVSKKKAKAYVELWRDFPIKSLK